MLQIYGTYTSSPANKVRYVANFLNTPFEYHQINLMAGEQRTPEFLKMNPLAKIPAIDDNGFCLGESDAIIRYLANKKPSAFYPQDLQERAMIDQWIDYASHHVSMAMSKIIFNTYYYKLMNTEKDTRSFEEGHRFLSNYLVIIEGQLKRSKFIASDQFTLADIAMLAALDACELCSIDLTAFSCIQNWRNKLMQESFYTKCHKGFTESFKQALNI